jgi:hypothetical protein
VILEPPSRPCPHPYQHVLSSADGLWHIGIKPVIFGCRVIAWHRDGVGPTIDYCAGDSASFLLQLLAAIVAIFRRLPDGITEAQLMRLMPGWQRRPINLDPCWQQLQLLADGTTPLAAPET